MITYVMLCGCEIKEKNLKQIKVTRPNGKFTYKIGCTKHQATCDHRKAICACGNTIIAGLAGEVSTQCTECTKEQKRKKEREWKQRLLEDKINPRGQYCKKIYACQKREKKTGKAFICKSCKKFDPIFPGVNPDI